jgi:glycosyltransferase involved in cell wall biosynthesis
LRHKTSFKWSHVKKAAGAAMKITHVNFARGFRGGERQTVNLIEGLALKGVEQHLVCRPAAALIERVRHLDVKIVEVSHPLLGHLWTPAADLIHVHEARAAYWAAIEHALHKTPYIITRRIPNAISDSRITAAVYRHARLLFGVSQDVARGLAWQTGRAVNAILSSSTFQKVNAQQVLALRQQFGKGPVIGHIGALHEEHKGQSVLIEAFRILLKKYPDARLVLVGEGPDRARFEALAGNDPRVVFAGFQRNVDVWNAAMDVLAFPSRSEGLGSSVLDAMALGVPVVSSTVGGLPELIGEDVRGLGVRERCPIAWAGAIDRLLGDAALRARLVKAGQRFAQQNNAEAMTHSYLRAYATILRQHQIALRSLRVRQQGG